jgi:RpiR family transcriptional regulator, carbohydrate utilization regulator
MTPTDRISPLERRIGDSHSLLSRRRRELLQRILSDSDQTFFLSARQLAKRLNVNAATIIRTVQTLGYKGFGDFAEELRHHFVTHVTPHANMVKSTGTNLSLGERVRGALDNDIARIGNVGATLDVVELEALAKEINQAHSVFIAADDINFAAALQLGWSLNFFGINCQAVESATLQSYKVRKLTPSDILIAIGVRRCLKATVEALIMAKSRGVKTIAITDSRLNPLGRRADAILLTSVEGPNPAGSFAPLSALISALVIAIAHGRPDDPDAPFAFSDEEYMHGDRWWVETDDLA